MIKSYLNYLIAIWKVFKQAPNSVNMQRVFEALASTTRRKILAYLSKADMTAGEIAARFEISKPAVSQHLSVLENAGLVTSEKRGQYLANTLNGYLQEVCPVSRPLKVESAAKAARRDEG